VGIGHAHGHDSAFPVGERELQGAGVDAGKRVSVKGKVHGQNGEGDVRGGFEGREKDVEIIEIVLFVDVEIKIVVSRDNGPEAQPSQKGGGGPAAL
jgi:hypothetical protein